MCTVRVKSENFLSSLSITAIKCPKVDMKDEDAKAFAARDKKIRMMGQGKSAVSDAV